MRILHLHDRAEFQGGVEQILHDTAAGLSRRGHPQGLLTPDGPRDEGFASAFSHVGSGAGAAASFRPDVLVVHKFADVDLLASLQALHPTVQVVHDHDLYCPRRHKYFPLTHGVCDSRAGTRCVLQGCLLRRGTGPLPLRLETMATFERRRQVALAADSMIAGSRYSARQLDLNGFDPARVRVVPPVPAAVDQARLLPPGEPGRMLFMGQAVRGKGLDLLLRAAARLTGDWRLDVAGSGPQLDECRGLAARLGLGDRVHFAGWVDHAALEEWIARARFVVVPSRWPEPFGMVGIEAMARGRPVVAFDTGGIADWLRGGETGLLAAPGDIRSLAARIQVLLDDPELAERMGAEGARHVAGRFTHQGFLDAMEQVLAEIATVSAESVQGELQNATAFAR
jgi:glycosyltransferase involved in cell wall biosynthesis